MSVASRTRSLVSNSIIGATAIFLVEVPESSLRCQLLKVVIRSGLSTKRSKVSPGARGLSGGGDFIWVTLRGFPFSVNSIVQHMLPRQVIKRLHSEFHQCAGSVLKEATTGKRETATQLLDGSFTDKSNILVRALGKWKGELQAGQ